MKICAKNILEIQKKEKRKRNRKRIIGSVILLFCLYRIVFSLFLMSSNIRVTAHRGSTQLAPENTIASVLEAIALDVDFIEIDVQLSKDSQVFLLHDPSFKRVAKVDKRPRDLTYEEISQLNVGAYKAREDAIDLITFSAPLLEDVIKVCILSNVKLNVELKDNGYGEELAEKVVVIIQENDFVERCVVSSYSQRLLRRVKQLEPEIKVGLITNSNAVTTYMKNNFVDFYSVRYVSLSPSIVMYAHSRNKEIHCWTPSTKVAIQAAIHAGADNIITDNVELTKFLIVSNRKKLD